MCQVMHQKCRKGAFWICGSSIRLKPRHHETARTPIRMPPYQTLSISFGPQDYVPYALLQTESYLISPRQTEHYPSITDEHSRQTEAYPSQTSQQDKSSPLARTLAWQPRQELRGLLDFI
ncbi:uncharacterized protein [Drosophila pseudoobscura]|uniref:Uncharacterized protein n=1 Tax=Drosophila pseudoobscura pseudoobscura TaxID=46245 RepID=A0A6I8W912_DROPS|nr:uncharacterized protein LOC117184846 [Drosophila pseudoobscura]